ncbi:MAG TPA: gliding motility lipoprotein GldH [Bacteroidales bacterium]|nr:gliding motility lipoprotein GldH [Bacteroidales bacterium]HRZ47952.1 gliding motility lipoprotein GldH [Bacteroidales bacterium]
MASNSFPDLFKKLPAVVILGFLLWLIPGCKRNMIFEEQFAFGENKWKSGNFVRFSFEVPDTVTPCNLYLLVRNSTDYSYANLYLFLHTILPDSSVAADTLDIPLAAADGKWLGQGIGKYRDNKVLIRPAFRFPRAGTYHMEIEQAMREKELSGISAIGLSIETNSK